MTIAWIQCETKKGKYTYTWNKDIPTQAIDCSLEAIITHHCIRFYVAMLIWNNLVLKSTLFTTFKTNRTGAVLDLLAPLHDVLKRSQELFLKLKVSQLSFLQEFHGELSKRVRYKERHIFRRKTTDLRRRRVVKTFHYWRNSLVITSCDSD